MFGDDLQEPATNFTAFPGSRRIEVHFAALLSIWAVSHAALLVGAAAMSATRQGEATLDASPDADVLKARELIAAARALIRDKEAPWPAGLPVPQAAAKPGAFDWYANNLFLAATGWVLLHEIAHIRLGHGGGAGRHDSLRQEREADDWATRWVLEGAPADLTKEFRVLSIAVGLVWLAVLDGVRRGSTTHPHAWERLAAVSPQLETHELSPGLESATHVMKVLFLQDDEAETFDTPNEAFFGTLISVSRLDR
jgi:hypothetical protein